MLLVTIKVSTMVVVGDEAKDREEGGDGVKMTTKTPVVNGAKLEVITLVVVVVVGVMLILLVMEVRWRVLLTLATEATRKETQMGVVLMVGEVHSHGLY